MLLQHVRQIACPLSRLILYRDVAHLALLNFAKQSSGLNIQPMNSLKAALAIAAVVIAIAGWHLLSAHGRRSREGLDNPTAPGGTASPALPSGCALPPDLGLLGPGVEAGTSNACAAGSTLASGESCNLACAQGYKQAGGSPSFTCQDQATGPSLRCSAISCVVPDHFDLGVQGTGAQACTHGATLKPGESCEVGCKSGYSSSGGSSVFSCSQTGETQKPSLSCKRVACPLPPFGKEYTWGGDNPCDENGTLLSGQSCSVKCASGFSASTGSDTFTCDDAGNLTPASLKCKPNTCKLPPAFGVGRASGGTDPCIAGGLLDAGGGCTVKCAPGFKATGGVSDYSCGQGGELTAASLRCEPVTCAVPAEFGTGVTGTGETPCMPGSQLKAGESCDVACAPTFELVGGEKTLAGKVGTRSFKCSGSGFLTKPEMDCRQDNVVAYNAVWAIDVGGGRN